jgi:hypothetical protein
MLGGFGLATVVFLALALRAAFGSARKLTSIEVKVVSCFFIACGAFLILAGLLTGPTFMMLAVGASGVGVGIYNLSLINKA